MRLDDLQESACSYASAAAIPRASLPMFGPSRGAEGLRVAEDGAEFVVTMDERGGSEELIRSREESEILYWIFSRASFALAQEYVTPLVVSARRRRDIRIARQLEILDSLEPRWASRFESEVRQTLDAETGEPSLVDERIREIRSLRVAHRWGEAV